MDDGQQRTGRPPTPVTPPAEPTSDAAPPSSAKPRLLLDADTIPPPLSDAAPATGEGQAAAPTAAPAAVGAGEAATKEEAKELNETPQSPTAAPTADKAEALAKEPAKEAAKTPASGAAPANEAAAVAEQGPKAAVDASAGSVPAAKEAAAPPSSSRGPAKDVVGSTIDGRYIVEALIGEGGMGLVYRCRHRALGKLVAVKVLHRELAHDHDLTERFVIEAKAASAVGSAHIAETLDFGELPDGSTYFAMEHLEGRTLSELLEAEGHLAAGRVAHIGRQIAKGLAAAHAAGIVHRDLKPDNVFLVDRDGDPDFVKILDFGIAKVASAQNQLTRAGSVFGTPQYMSPEQATAGPVDHRSDIYALGVILYEMAVGKVPFDSEGPLTVMSMHVNESPLAPSAHPEAPQRIPQVLEATILRCLAKDAAERFVSMTELANALKRAEEPHAISHEAPVVLTRRKLDTGALPSVRATVSNVPPPFAQPDRRRWIAMGAAGAAAALIVLAIATRRGSEAPPPAATSVAAVVPVPPPPPRPAPAATAPAPPAAPESKRLVAIVVSPIDAVIFRGKDRLGQMPISVSVPPGERVRLVFLREGFWPRKVTIDGSKPRIIVRMAPIPGAKLRVPVPVGTAPAEAETGEETEAPEGSPQPPASTRPAASAKAPPSAKTAPATSAKAAPATSAKAAPAASAKAAATDEPSEE